jgi:hypothetical protein
LLTYDIQGPTDYYLPSGPYDDIVSWELPYTALFPYFSTGAVFGADYVAYQVDGAEGSRTVTFHWKTHGFSDLGGIYEFFVVFQESLPNEVTFYYRIMAIFNNEPGLVGASSPNGKSAYSSYLCPFGPVALTCKPLHRGRGYRV